MKKLTRRVSRRKNRVKRVGDRIYDAFLRKILIETKCEDCLESIIYCTCPTVPVCIKCWDLDGNECVCVHKVIGGYGYENGAEGC